MGILLCLCVFLLIIIAVSDSCLFFEKQMLLGTACLHLKSHNINNNPMFSFIRGCDGAKHSAALYRGFSSSSLGCLYA